MVIAVILILFGITFGISRGVQNAQARTKAKAELAAIAQGLEQFKAAHGDYPWAAETAIGGAAGRNANSNQLLRALMGWMKFERTGTTVNFTLKATDEVPSEGPRSYIDPTKLGLSDPDTLSLSLPPDELYLTDPWGNAYVYLYRTDDSAEWENFGYILFSMGPDGTLSTSGLDLNKGTMTRAHRDQEQENFDNIHAGE